MRLSGDIAGTKQRRACAFAIANKRNVPYVRSSLINNPEIISQGMVLVSQVMVHPLIA